MRRVSANLMIFFCLLTSSHLQGMEEGVDGNNSASTVTLEVFNELKLPANVTSLCFDQKTMTLGYAYYKSRNKSRKNHQMQFINMESLEEISSSKVSKQIVYSCFNHSATQIGMVAQDGSIYEGDWQGQRLIKPIQHNDSFISLAFSQDHCFTVTKKGILFRSEEKEYKPVFTLPIHSNSFPCSVSSLSACKKNNDVALVGQLQDNEGVMGFLSVVTIDKDTISHRSEYEQSPITKSVLSNDGSLLALVVGKKVIVMNLSDRREWTKYFDYVHNVAELCFDPKSESLFVGLEDGSLYHSSLENASTRDTPENYSEFLYYLENPIALLSCIKKKQWLCAATLYKVMLFNVAFNNTVDDDAFNNADNDAYGADDDEFEEY